MDFRVIKAEKITETVKELLTDCNYNIGSDITNALEKAKETEKSEVGKQVLCQLI